MKVLVAAVLGVVVLGGCSEPNEPAIERVAGAGLPGVVRTVCDRGHRLYILNHRAITVVPNGCPEGQ